MEVTQLNPPPVNPAPDAFVLLGMSPDDLRAWLASTGQPPYRVRQLQQWIYHRGARHLGAITVLPRDWREAHRHVGIGRSRLAQQVQAGDGATKLLLELEDGNTVETVGIPTAERLTVCVSSQVGCPMACRFCATGKGGYQRSLASHEMIDQVLSMGEVMGRQPTHVVFMGMGEPLLNLSAVLSSVQCFCRDLGIGQRRITISTVGIPHRINTLARKARQQLGRSQLTLAVSLHASNQSLREHLIPTAKAYPLEDLLEDCRSYVAQTGRRVSFEYVLLAGINDQPHHAVELAERVRGFQSHVNLMAYNPIPEEDFQRPRPQRVERFRQILARQGVAVSVRSSRGLDRNAACGQLRRRLSTTAAAPIPR